MHRKFSPEPWKIDRDAQFGMFIEAANGWKVYAMPNYITEETSREFSKPIQQVEADGTMLDESVMERIVACVNFCRHQSTEFLQQHRIVPIKSKDDITTDKSRPDFSEFKPALLVAVVEEKLLKQGE